MELKVSQLATYAEPSTSQSGTKYHIIASSTKFHNKNTCQFSHLLITLIKYIFLCKSETREAQDKAPALTELKGMT